MKYLTTTLIVLALLGCSEKEVEIPNPDELTGNWVSLETFTDTLSFNQIEFEDSQIMYVKRAELLKTGPYEYELLPNNEISLLWVLSSNMNSTKYYFWVDGEKLRIGNFFESPSGAILTFVKID